MRVKFLQLFWQFPSSLEITFDFPPWVSHFLCSPMGDPSFAFRYARPCCKEKQSPTCCCIFRVRRPLTATQQRKQAAAAAATAAATAATAAPDPTPAADPAPEAPKPDEAAKPAEDAKPAEEAAKTPFTPAEDVALLSLKGQNKPWKEIAEVLVGRDKDELRHRYKEIGGVVGGNAGEAGKQGATVEPVKEGAAPAQPNQGKGNKGKQQKGEGGKKGKGKQDEAAKPEEKKDEPAAAAAAAVPAPAPTNPNEAVVADKKDAKIKGILRRGSDGALQFGEAVIPDGATTLNGCPIIYLEENDPLDVYEVIRPISHSQR